MNWAQKAARQARELLRTGRGQGHGANYRPLLEIGSIQLPPMSKIVLKPLRLLGRNGHFLSLNEWKFALFLLWLGVLDLREQYPLWPWRHPHPLYGRLDYRPRQMPMSVGSLRIAADLGIDHGTWFGSSIPYFANEDIVVTVGTRRRVGAAMFSMKPEENLKRQSLPIHNQERLLLAQTYASQLELPWFLASKGNLHETLLENIDGLETHAIPYNDRLAKLTVKFGDYLEQQFDLGHELGHATRVVCSRMRLCAEDFEWLLGNAIWHRRISLDPRQPWFFHELPQRTSFDWVRNARRELFGDFA